MRTKMKCILLGVVMLVSVVIPSNAYFRVEMSGNVIYKDVIPGPGGLTNQIILRIDTIDGLYWDIICKRSNANLGLCAPAEVGDFIFANGTVVSSGMAECYGSVSPTGLAVVAKP